ncbi:MAG: 1-acyl-sn-glycerol-3-phosphate acyltransferase [Ilumatobacter sp.]|uniref:1-acyl-sn-glycerol-3-phosphate acyltransferase n=1 Tax=Ilumatobacter sp. TaxID=1967498 RepID=UPI00261C4530|nr:1-acyl-sn-glycerol-3-phosphate acyltransferase [Ilumatobacter sp.]MDJ0770231.1 1-acyl-sn-glycerol-3-phosphate acyltransferase [Ilumatobacter sp.]
MAAQTRRDRLRRRSLTIPALVAGTVLLTLLVPVWLPLALVLDALRLRFRFPLARLLAFAVCWCWIETAGVHATAWLWLTGRAGDAGAHYRLMGWWAGALMNAIRVTTRIEPQVVGAEALEGGNAIVLARHVSLADSLLSGWATATVCGLWPRYVLKKELLYDPSLDIVGLRIPNHFLDRTATDADAELDALRRLAAGVGPDVVAVIFPEGTRSNDQKRARALEKIEESDPERAARLAGLRRLLPPRAAGTTALIDGAPDADLVLAWHTGFDGLDTFSGMISKLASPLPPVRFVTTRVPRSEVPDGAAFPRWLDDRWLELDAAVDAALGDGTIDGAGSPPSGSQ